MGVGSVLENTYKQREYRHSDENADHDENVFLLVHLTRQLNSVCIVGRLRDDLVEEYLTADDRGEQREAGAHYHTEQNGDKLELEGLEVRQQPYDHTLSLVTFFADSDVLIGVDGTALGAFSVELLEAGIVLLNDVPLLESLPNSDKGEQSALAGVGTVADYLGDSGRIFVIAFVKHTEDTVGGCEIIYVGIAQNVQGVA